MRHPGILIPVLAVAALAGCGGSSSSSTHTSSTADPPNCKATTIQPSPGASTSNKVIPDSGNSSFAMGTIVTITTHGFIPHTLLSPMGFPVIWKNDTNTIQSVHFDNFGQPVCSGPIKPGGTWKINPDQLASIVYHSTYPPHFHALLQVQNVGNN